MITTSCVVLAIMPEYWKIRREYLKIKRTYCARRAAYRSHLTCLSLKGRLLIAYALRAYRSWAVCLLLVTCLLIAQKKLFREFAATLPHIAQNAFVQGVLGAVAATRSVAANGILAQNAAKKSLILLL